MSKGTESRMQRFVLYNFPPGSSRALHLNVSRNKSRRNLQTAISVLLIAAQFAAPAALAQSIAAATSSENLPSASSTEGPPSAAEAASQSSIPDVAAPPDPASEASSAQSQTSNAPATGAGTTAAGAATTAGAAAAGAATTGQDASQASSDASSQQPLADSATGYEVPADRKWLSITRKNMPTLQGSVKQDSRSPFVAGEEQVVPKGTKIDLVMPADCGVLNSEVSQIGDEVTMRIAANLANGKKVILPAGWYMRGLVTRVDKQKDRIVREWCRSTSIKSSLRTVSMKSTSMPNTLRKTAL